VSSSPVVDVETDALVALQRAAHKAQKLAARQAALEQARSAMWKRVDAVAAALRMRLVSYGLL
jgi:hypothetical protein